jgi:hypothetical protein
MLVERKNGLEAQEMFVGLGEVTGLQGKAAKSSENISGTLNHNGHTKEINGFKKINGFSRVRSELRSVPTERTDVLNGFGDTMLMSDLIKNEEDTEMFQNIFDAKVTNDGRDIAFPGSNARIEVVLREKGKAILAVPGESGKRDEWHLVNNTAVRDVENNEGPALDIIFPKSEDGVKVLRVTKEGVEKRYIQKSSHHDDEVAVSIAKRLLSSESEVRPSGKVERIVARDLPLTVFANGREIHVIDESIKGMRDREDGHEKSMGVSMADEELLTLEKVEEYVAERAVQEITLLFDVAHKNPQAIKEADKRLNGNK